SCFVIPFVSFFFQRDPNKQFPLITEIHCNLNSLLITSMFRRNVGDHAENLNVNVLLNFYTSLILV
ncbi:hypothetical protein J4213_00695, partial [Candidatus Woesearchaeota archaeon]|nr:hypothetical protein [Candidatus Woesearchaeota archaeon]